jgi:hypothetical protein
MKKKAPIVETVRKVIAKLPACKEASQALAELQKYLKIRKEILTVFGEDESEQPEDSRNPISRLPQVDQYFIIREALEGIGVTFPPGALPQAVCAKQFKLELKKNTTARLYWNVGEHWSVEHKDAKELSGVWEDFDLDEFFSNNNIYLDD